MISLRQLLEVAQSRASHSRPTCDGCSPLLGPSKRGDAPAPTLATQVEREAEQVAQVPILRLVAGGGR